MTNSKAGTLLFKVKQAIAVEQIIADAKSKHTFMPIEEYQPMNDSDLQRARQAAIRAESRATYSRVSEDWAIAAGFYRNAAALWRVAGDKEKAADMITKAREMEGKLK
jgi:hypothetical protein